MVGTARDLLFGLYSSSARSDSEKQTLSYNISSGATNVLGYVVTCPASKGIVDISQDGILTYLSTSEVSYPSEKDVFTYSEVLSNEGSQVTLVTITIAAVNDRPWLVDFDERDSTEQAPIEIILSSVLVTSNSEREYNKRLLFQDDRVYEGRMAGFDIDEDNLRWTIRIPPSNGVIRAAGCARGGGGIQPRCRAEASGNEYRYYPDNDFEGQDSFVFSVDDRYGPDGNQRVHYFTVYGKVYITTGKASRLPEAEQYVYLTNLFEDEDYFGKFQHAVIEDTTAIGLRYFVCDPAHVDADNFDRLKELCGRRDWFARESNPWISIIGGDAYVSEAFVPTTARGDMVGISGYNFDGFHDYFEIQCDATAKCENARPGEEFVGQYLYRPDTDAFGINENELNRTSPLWLDEVLFNTYHIDESNCVNGPETGGSDACLLTQDKFVPPGRLRFAVLPVDDHPIAMTIGPSFGVPVTPYASMTLTNDTISSAPSRDVFAFAMADFDRPEGPGNFSVEIISLPSQSVLYEVGIIGTVPIPDRTECTADFYLDTVPSWRCPAGPLSMGFTKSRLTPKVPQHIGDVNELPWVTTALADWNLVYQPPPMVFGEFEIGYRSIIDGQVLLDSESTFKVAVQCQPGYFRESLRGSGLCVPCNPGEFSSVENAIKCDSCLPGTYSEVASSKCTSCPVGTFTDTFASPFCRDCPMSASTVTTGSANLTDCQCNNGFFGPDGGLCALCPNEETISPQVVSTTIGGEKCLGMYCLPYTRCIWTENQPYPRRWPKNAEGMFIEVENQYAQTIPARYIGNVSMSVSSIPPPHWSSVVNIRKCMPFSDSDPFGGPREVACPPLNSTEQIPFQTFYCTNGYKGTGCSSCEDGWYKIRGICNKCPERSGVIGIAFGFLFAVFVPIVFRVCDMLGDVQVISMLLSFLQSIDLVSLIKVKWPKQMTWLFEGLSVLNLNLQLLSPECYLKSFRIEDRFFIVVLIPVGMTALTLLMIILMILKAILTKACRPYIFACFGSNIRRPPIAYRKRPAIEEEEEEDGEPAVAFRDEATCDLPNGWHRWFVAFFSHKRYQLAMFFTYTRDRKEIMSFIRRRLCHLLTFLHITYIILIRAALMFFNCTRISVDGEPKKLYACEEDFSLLCYQYGKDTRYGKIYPYALAALFAYPIGILFIFALLLFVTRNNLNEPWTKEMVGFFYVRFNYKYFYYEVVVMARKLLLAVAAVVFMSGDSTAAIKQAAVGLITLFVALLLQFYSKPFDSVNLDRMESITLISLFVLLLVGIVNDLNEGSVSPSVETFLAFLNYILLMVAFIALCTYALYDVAPKVDSHARTAYKKRKIKKRERRESMLEERRQRRRADSLVMMDGASKIRAMATARKFARNTRKSAKKREALSEDTKLMLTDKGEDYITHLMNDPSSGSWFTEHMSVFNDVFASVRKLMDTEVAERRYFNLSFEKTIKKDIRSKVLEGLAENPQDENIKTATLIDGIMSGDKEMWHYEESREETSGENSASGEGEGSKISARDRYLQMGVKKKDKYDSGRNSISLNLDKPIKSSREEAEEAEAIEEDSIQLESNSPEHPLGRDTSRKLFGRGKAVQPSDPSAPSTSNIDPPSI